ncbi:hypothetical protein GCK72_009106 [Caenorhabditis remanei]|uniref:Uncharacterized protein n=1 Tax=Caenorhabditis remanei TaxID=31234 RepID=A0A6A5H1Q1_CAERE|nr:hypothetical protein GCK72_009106 [Caenorhabditis remanei]KAF1760855.1 hypothetical protein GCK72_009106 [Caenorhabditis remanei]
MSEESKDFERIDDLETLLINECEEVLKNPLEKIPAIQCMKNLTTIRETFDGNTRLPYYAQGVIFSKKVRLMEDLIEMEKTYKYLKIWLLFVLIPIVSITVYCLIHIIIDRAIPEWFYLLTSGPVTFLIGFFVVMPLILCDTSEEEEDICTAEFILSSSDDDEEIKIRKTLNDLIDFQIDVIDTLFEIEDLNQKERRTQFKEFLLLKLSNFESVS